MTHPQQAEHYPTPESSAPDRLPLSAAQQDELLALTALLYAARQQRLSGGGDLQVGGAAPRALAACLCCCCAGSHQPMCTTTSSPPPPCLQSELELVLTLEGQQVPAAVRPAGPGLAAPPPPGGGQALEVQLPHRILVARDRGGSTAQLLRGEVDGRAVALQVLGSSPRSFHVQHCGAQRSVAVDTPLAAQLAVHMPAPRTQDLGKVGRGGGWETQPGGWCEGVSAAELDERGG